MENKRHIQELLKALELYSKIKPMVGHYAALFIAIRMIHTPTIQ